MRAVIIWSALIVASAINDGKPFDPDFPHNIRIVTIFLFVAALVADVVDFIWDKRNA